MGQAIEGYETHENNINTPPAKGIRIFRRESDGKYYAKLPDGSLDLIGGGAPTPDVDIVPVKLPVRAASIADVNILAPGAVIDGVVLVNGDRILLKNQIVPSENGTYIFNGAATPLTRTTDTFEDGYLVVVTEGTVNHDSLYELNTPNPIVIGTTPLTFIAFFPVSGWSPPIVRYVYLVQDASDSARMGGAANNTFTTFQAAYNAANALQVANGGLVVIEVGVITSAASGGLVLTANFNSSVQIKGLGSTLSNLGAITGTNGVGNGFSITTSMYGAIVGAVNNSALLAAGGNGGTINISGDDLFIGPFTSNGGVGAVSGNGGSIILNSDSLAGIQLLGNIDSIGSGNGFGGNIVLSKVFSPSLSATTTGGPGGCSGDVTLLNVSSVIGGNGLNINMTKNGINGDSIFGNLGHLSCRDSILGVITQTNNSTTIFPQQFITNSEIGRYVRVASNVGGWDDTLQPSGDNGTVIVNSRFSGGGNAIDFTASGATVNLVGALLMENCYLIPTSNALSNNFRIAHNGSAGSLGLFLTINNTKISGNTTVSYGQGVLTPGSFTWESNTFGKNTGQTISILATGTQPLPAVTLNNNTLEASLTMTQSGVTAASNPLTINSGRGLGLVYSTSNTGATSNITLNSVAEASGITSTTNSVAGNGMNIVVNTSPIVSLVQSLFGGSSGRAGAITVRDSSVSGSVTSSSTSTGGLSKVITFINSSINSVNAAGNVPIVLTSNNSDIIGTTILTSPGQTITVNASNGIIETIDEVSNGKLINISMGLNNPPTCIANITGNGLEIQECYLQASVSTLDAAAPQTVAVGATKDVATGLVISLLTFFSTAPTVNVTRSPLVSA